MCHDLYLIHPRCGHVKNIAGQTVYCELYVEKGEVCPTLSNTGDLPKDYEVVIDNEADAEYECGLENDVDTRYYDQNREEPSYCSNCCKGTTKPMKKRHRDAILHDHLGDMEKKRTSEDLKSQEKEKAEDLEQQKQADIEWEKTQGILKAAVGEGKWKVWK